MRRRVASLDKGEFSQLRRRHRFLAALWLGAHWTSYAALFGIVLTPLVAGVRLYFAHPAGLTPGTVLWGLAIALAGSVLCALIMVASVAFKSHLGKRSGGADWDG